MTHMSFWGFLAIATIASTIGSILRGGRSRWQMGGGRMAWRRLGFDPAEEFARLDGAIAERDTMIEDLQHRLSEMESRLDFAERLLTEKSSAAAQS